MRVSDRALSRVLQDMSSVACDLVPALMEPQPPRSHHLLCHVHRANGMMAAGVIEPVSSGDQIAVELSLTQRFALRQRGLVHAR